MWIRPLALAAGALFLSLATYGYLPALGGALIFVAGVSTIWAAWLGLSPRLRPRDPYDLGELARVHEEEEIRALDPEGALGNPERVVCLRCMTDYPFRLGACPKCGLSR